MDRHRLKPLKDKGVVLKTPHGAGQGKQTEFTGKKEGKEKGLTCS